MGRLFKLQIAGPLALFLAILGAEAAAYALAHSPTSEFLWYINLKLFGFFQRSHYMLSNNFNLPGFQLYGIAVPILALALYGIVRSKALPLAIASNLSFAGAAFLLLGGEIMSRPSHQASLGAVIPTNGDSLFVWLSLLGSCALSFFISHGLYLGAIRARG